MKRTIIILSLFSTVSYQTVAQTYSEWIEAVDEYRPAPGQFVNTLPVATDADTPATMAEKCTRILAGPLNQQSEDDLGTMITLGAWGGYVTFHFDHPIANIAGQKDLFIAGNAVTNGAEPGIVMVMKDENSNGRPDDTWYELRGSCDEDSVGKLTFGYEITYTRQSMADTPWKDNQGREGVVPRNAYHEDNEYYPLWISDDELSFSGTLLPGNGIVRPVTGYYFLQQFAWGYVDNQPNTKEELCSFDLAWAVDPVSREAVQLDCIHFVRVYTALNQVGGNGVGETSTEVSGARDLHLDASIAYMENTSGIRGVSSIGTPTADNSVYDLRGRRVSGKPVKGIYIIGGKKHTF